MKRDKFYLSTIDENAHILAKQYGLGIEIAEFCTPWFLDTDFAEIDPKIREKLTYSDRFALHAPFSELFPCAIDPKVREIAAERYRQIIQVAQGYGIRKIVIHGGYNPRIYFPVWYTEQSVLFWKEFVQEIPNDMVFCLENVFEEEPAMLTEIVRQINDSRIRMCLDVGHVNAYSKISVMEWLEQCADFTEHFHIHNNDTSRDAHGQLIDGTIPMKELLAVIDEKCPDATLTLELMDAEPSVRWLLGETDMKNSFSYFQNRECEYFPCHKVKDDSSFNCLFCYCPLYALGDRCGGNFVYTEKGIKDCSGCLIPHSAGGYDYILSRFSQIAQLARKKEE